MPALEYFEAWVVLMEKKKDKLAPQLRRSSSDPQVIKRLAYIRDVFFFGSTAEMARAASVTPRYLSRVLCGHSNMTLPMTANFVQRLGISADWLVCGSGAVFSAAAPHKDIFTPPKKVRAARSTYAPGVTVAMELPTSLSAPWLNSGNLLSDVVPPRRMPGGGLYATAVSHCSTASRAAELIHAARTSMNSVSFFLAASSLFAGAAEILKPLFSYEYSDCAVFTLSAVFQDLLLSGLSDSFDVHAAAKKALPAAWVTATCFQSSYACETPIVFLRFWRKKSLCFLFRQNLESWRSTAPRLFVVLKSAPLLARRHTQTY